MAFISSVTHWSKHHPSLYDTAEPGGTVAVLIDEGIYQVLRSVNGAYACRQPPIPKRWNPITRPHVALLLPADGKTFRFFLSLPAPPGSSRELEVTGFDDLPLKSVIEVRHGSMDCRYYRREKAMWMKVAEVRNQLLLEIFLHSGLPLVVPLTA